MNARQIGNQRLQASQPDAEFHVSTIPKPPAFTFANHDRHAPLVVERHAADHVGALVPDLDLVPARSCVVCGALILGDEALEAALDDGIPSCQAVTRRAGAPGR